MTAESLPLIYFGKLPARGDFVRARAYMTETNTIDQWVSEALTHSDSLLSESPDEVENGNSDTLSFLNFSHVDTASQHIVTGVLLPSHDSSHRNYPLIGFGVLHLDKPKTWMNYLPIKSMTIWNEAYELLNIAKSETDSQLATEALNQSQLSINNNASTYYYDFINTTTLQDMAILMNLSKSKLIQQIIATGLLFLPTFTKGFGSLNKAIYWTLTSDRTNAIHMATFWHDLISGFYQPHQLYLNTYLYRIANCYHLLLSFTPPNGQLLNQLSPYRDHYPDDWVVIAESEWTQSYIAEDIGLSRFHKILSQDDLYLYDTRQLFKKIFLAQ